MIDSRCTACGVCIMTCPEHALVPAPRRPLVEASLCTQCLACIEICPVDAISTVPGDGGSESSDSKAEYVRD